METTLADVRDYKKLSDTLSIAGNIVTKDYLCRLKDLDVCEAPKELKALKIANYMRVYRFRRFVTDKKENTIDKFVTVLNAAYSSRSTVVAVIKGRNPEVEYYLGVVSKDVDQQSVDLITQEEIFRGALTGNFPGLDLESLYTSEIEELNEEIFSGDNIAAVSGLASIRNTEKNEMEQYVQGMEHLVDALKGRNYSVVIIADPVSVDEMNLAKNGYENLYTQLSPFLNTSLSFNETDSLSVTNSQTEGVSDAVGESVSLTQNYTRTSGWSHTDTYSKGSAKDTGRSLGMLAGAGIVAAATVLSGGLALPLVAGGAAVGGAVGDLMFGSQNENSSNSSTETGSMSESGGTTRQRNENHTKSVQNTQGESKGKNHGRTMQFSNENRIVKDLLQKIDKNIERIEQCESFGAFNCAAYVISSDPETNAVVANEYGALMKGENSFLQSSHINQWVSSDPEEKTIKEYLKKYSHPNFLCEGMENVPISPASLESAYDVAVSIGLPKRSVNGLPVMESAAFGRNIYRLADSEKNENKIRLGTIFHMGNPEQNNFVDLFTESMSMHTFITGSTGSGKSNTVYQILNELHKKRIHFLVIEPAKGEYKHMFGGTMANVYGTNPEYARLLRINPFKFDRGIHVLEHVDRLVEIFNVCWPMYAAMPAVLKEAVLQAYEVCGWDLTKSVNTVADDLYPTFKDLLEELKDVIENSAYDNEVKSNYKGSLETRVKSLTNGLNGQIFSADEVDNEELFDADAIIDLSRIGSLETKSLIMGILVMRLSEYRMTHAQGMNLPLKHVTVLEEAHNILKRTSTEQDIEGSNMAGKSVEMISNAIAEMRTYGEGFIIADQSPNAVDISAIRNTNTKIIMRLPDEADRRLVGKSAALTDDQLDEIAKLPKGVAVVYQNDWVEPILCKIQKFPQRESLYSYERPQEQEAAEDAEWFKAELLKLLVKGRINEDVDIDVKELRAAVPSADLSTKNKIGLYRMLDEYESTGKLRIWEDQNFEILSAQVVELMDCGNRVERMIISAGNFEELNKNFYELIHRQFREASEEVSLTISQCFMKDYSVKDEKNVELYSAWREVVRKRGGLL